MNDLVCLEHAVIPVVYRPSVNALARNLVAEMTADAGTRLSRGCRLDDRCSKPTGHAGMGVHATADG